MAPKRTGRIFRGAPAFIRSAAALVVLALFVYAYLSPGTGANGLLAFLAGGQFSAALYGAGLAGAVLVVLILTALFGRFFCSALCPLGTAQELFWRAGAVLRRKTGKGRPRGIIRRGYAAAPGARYVIPLLAGAGLVFSFAPFMMVFDPLSSFGRGMGALRGFLAGPGGGGLLAYVLAVPIFLILLAAVPRGRAFCGFCPVGVTLGLFSSAAPFGMNIGAGCVSCGICEKKCPAGCLDSGKKQLDSERCVLCFSCSSACPSGSVSYGLRTKAGETRRFFLKGAGKASLLCGAAYLLGPAARLFPGPSAAADLPILPPGAKSLRQYAARCIGCQACIASCPAGVIRIKDTLHPQLDYAALNAAACQFNCVECGNVCPTGAITRLDADRKHRTRIALSTLYFERCVVNTRHESCGACAEVCPTGALIMTAYDEPGIPFLTRPVYDEQYCIGCGACLVACPAEPRAFTLAAVSEQSLTAGPRPSGESGDELRIQNTDDFPF
ncbi:MAG: 4Fe-4S dicluster domain-containing protein [Treponema sp.]|jgi:ferredoxin|nr:4Fe-4S dicluster domain-containing protein [Treponema sp.]